MHPLLNIATTAARQAGDIIVRNLDQIDHMKVTEKQKNDFFCEVDVKAEQTIINTIHKAYPEHGIIAEESGIRHENADVIWIIDPLDGTSNYLHGFPFYAVSIAVQVKNRIEHAVVYDPIRHECFAASRGRGARLNDRRLRVSKQTQLQASLLGIGLPHHSESLRTNWPLIQALFEQCARIRRTGSAALNLAYVASGRLDGFCGFELSIWDIAAGCLLVQEAGGLMSDAQGGERYLQQGNVFASTPKILKSLLQLVAMKTAMKST